MAQANPRPKTGAAATARAAQEFVPIKEVRDGVVILKDGGLRMVLMASSINLALKSADEQEAVIAQFQDFLNSLEFTVQFFVESRKLDIRPYVAILEERMSSELDDLMKLQIREYIAFIRDFTDRANIMSKNFFIVVPYDPALITRGAGALKSLMPGQKPEGVRSPTSSSRNIGCSLSSASASSSRASSAPAYGWRSSAPKKLSSFSTSSSIRASSKSR
jgi:type IV secretory pathway VirB4 component